MDHEMDNFDPVIGGVKLASSQIRKDSAAVGSLIVHDDLDRHIVRLLELHPSIRIRFRNRDLQSLDTPTKLLVGERH